LLAYRLNEDSELRFLEPFHAEELFALTQKNKEYLSEWLPWVKKNKEIEDSRRFIEATRQQFAENKGLHLGIFYRGKIAGVIGMHGIDWHNRSTSIGYWLGEQFMEKGLITMACRALIYYSFRELKLHRVEIRCAVENKKSRGVPERLGFKEEGRIREAELLDNYYTDHILYGFLAGDWNELEQDSGGDGPG